MNDGEIREGQSTVGGGSLPEEIMPTWILALKVKKPEVLVSILRTQKPALLLHEFKMGRFVLIRVLFYQNRMMPLYRPYPTRCINTGKFMKNQLDEILKSQNIAAILITGSADHNPAMVYFTGHVHVSRGALVIKPGEKPILIP